jgi:hypothetical protein
MARRQKIDTFVLARWGEWSDDWEEFAMKVISHDLRSGEVYLSVYGGSEFGVEAHPSAVGAGTALDEDQAMDDLHRMRGLCDRDMFQRLWI